MKQEIKRKKILWSCCFCNKGMTNPEVYLMVRETEQQFFAHKICFSVRMTAEAGEGLH